MNVLRRLTLRTLKKNPKRTLVTIVGIILATALITAVANLAISFQTSVVVFEKEENGDFHFSFSGVEPENLKFFENNVNIEKISTAEEVGYALLEGSRNPDKPYLYIYSMDEQCRNMAALKLNSGRWPENENEIVIPSHARSNGGSRLVVGDTVTLTFGVRDIGEGQFAQQSDPYADEGEKFVPSGQREYRVVGIMRRPSYEVEPWTAPGYTAVTCVSGDKAYASDVPDGAETNAVPGGKVTVFVSYTAKGLRNRWDVTKGLEKLAGGRSYNERLVRWEMLPFLNLSSGTMKMVYGMCGIVIAIIIVTSVFCIRNSFQIALTEKMRMYGILSSVGITAKQRRKLVYYEAFYLGMIGIPLGIGSGVLATYVLIRICSEMMRYVVDMKLYYAFSWLAVIAGMILAALTIFLSAFQSAGKAAKLSPISAIRSNETLRSGSGKLYVPGPIRGIFGIGGVLAYKNLRRSRVKYRTTVISIVVSVAVFIGMTTFVRLGFKATEGYMKGSGYPLVVSLEDEERNSQAAQISSWEEAQRVMMLRQTTPAVFSAKSVAYTPESFAVEKLGWVFEDEESRQNGLGHIWLVALGESAYEEYCNEIGISPGKAALGAILYAEFRVGVDDGSGMKYYEGTIAEFRKGDVLDMKMLYPALKTETGDTGEERQEAEEEIAEKRVSLPIVCQTRVQPGYMQGRDNTRIICIVSDAWLDENLAAYIYPRIDLCIQCEDADAMEARIRNEVPLYCYRFSNHQRAIRERNSFWLLLAIFLYGFITVIALIGVTNIFNTVTTNMELRSREFAMLRSVGMTGREFRHMVQLESLFYGGGALLIGIPLGCVLSRLFYFALGLNVEIPYEWPLKGILISGVAVTLLLFVIMRYSMGRINRKNMIETIQNENI